MPQTRKEQHPDFPGQYFIIKYMSAAKRQKRSEALEIASFPVAVVDPTTDKPYVNSKGDVQIATKVRLTDDMRLAQILLWFDGWCNEAGDPVIDLGDGPVKFDSTDFDGIREVLLDERLHVRRGEEVDQLDAAGEPVKNDAGETVKKTVQVTRNWLYVLSEKAALRSTFIADPPSTTSAS